MSAFVHDAKVDKIRKCRVCGNTSLLPCLDIGYQYLSSIFPDDLSYRSKLLRYPMNLVLCHKTPQGPECGLVQLEHDLDLSGMYKDYPYKSSSNSSMNRILEDVAQSGLNLGHLKPGCTVLDIGCNDGTLLSFFDKRGLSLIGIDAAHNIEPVFSSSSLRIKRGTYFTRSSYAELSSKPADLIFSIAMYYHLSNPISFTQDAADSLADNGVWIIQMAYLPSMLSTNMYDNIVHEHVGYYGIETMQWIMNQSGLEIFDVLLNDVYGGSFRIFVKKKGNSRYPLSQRLADYINQEKTCDLYSLKTYQNFESRIQKTRSDLQTLIAELKRKGSRVWVYGASTKGNTILQYCQLGADVLIAAADSNEYKWGKYLIGSDIPIKGEQDMRREKPDFLLSLPYSFTRHFIEREKDLVAQGTRFINPLPTVQILP